MHVPNENSTYPKEVTYCSLRNTLEGRIRSPLEQILSLREVPMLKRATIKDNLCMFQ